jgi:hypothetical protein
MKKLVFRRIVGASVGLALLATTVEVRAQGNAALAQSLFQEGKRLMTAGKYAEACPKLEESLRVEPATGTLLNVAGCHEKVGRSATAWAEYTEAAANARREGRSDRERFALDRAKGLEPTLARLTIVVPLPGRQDGLEVKVDGMVLGAPSWGMAMPVDTGRHAIEVRAPGKQTWNTQIDVSARQSLEVEVPPLMDAIPISAAPAAEPPPKPATPPKPDVAEPAVTSESQAGSHTAAYVIGGLGLVSLGAGAYFGLRAIDQAKDSDRACTPTCTTAGVELMDRANTNAWIANVGIGAGIVAVGVSAYMLLKPNAKSSDEALLVMPLVDLKGGGVAVQKAW